MTRDDFNHIKNWYELEEFCRDNNLTHCIEDVYDEDSYNGLARDDIQSWIDDGDSIRDICNRLDNYPSGYDRYILDSYYGEWYGTDDNDDRFDDYKENILSEIDDDFWDSEDEEDEENESAIEEAPIEPEDIDIMDVLNEAVGLSNGNLSITDSVEETRDPVINHFEQVVEEHVETKASVCSDNELQSLLV